MSFQRLIRSGNYEYPFEVLLPDDIPDSVEGLPGGAIIYKMKAVIERSGLVTKNIVCRKVCSTIPYQATTELTVLAYSDSADHVPHVF